MSKSVVLSFLRRLRNNLISIAYAKTSNKMWLRLLILLAVLLFLVILYNKRNPPARQEGFEQNDMFVLRQNNDIYDKFYTEKYDLIMKPEKRSSFEINTVIQMTQPTQDSVFLDVGSGTGHLVAALEYEGYRVYGIDKSPAMVERCEKSFPNSEIVCKDVLDTMAFEHNTFSHILCTGMTIYEIQDKEAFFKNCYYWLLPNGYLILHLVHRDKFNTIVPAAQTAFLQTNTGSKKQGEDRITKTNIDFPGFSYFSEYIFPKSDSTVLFTEKFSNSNGNIRQNEQTLYMDSIDSILKIAIRRGFIVHSKMNMSKANGDENQYLYVLERAM